MGVAYFFLRKNYPTPTITLFGHRRLRSLEFGQRWLGALNPVLAQDSAAVYINCGAGDEAVLHDEQDSSGDFFRDAGALD